jgi:hypothetical protein
MTLDLVDVSMMVPNRPLKKEVLKRIRCTASRDYDSEFCVLYESNGMICGIMRRLDAEEGRGGDRQRLLY